MPTGTQLRHPRPRRQRGGALITVLIFAVILSAGIGSMLLLTKNARRASMRFFYQTAVVNQAESGLEQAMYALNTAKSGDSSVWSSWTVSGGDATRTFSGFAYGSGVTGVVKVRIIGYTSSTPTAVARARITLSDGQQVEKWIRITVGNRSLFAYGLLARNHITASGGAYFDSWISDPDNNPATPAVAYSAGVARDNCPIATTSTSTPSITLGSADVYGRVAVGATTNAGLGMDWGGQVGPRGMPISGSYNLAAGALSTGFTASFENVPNPTGTTVQVPYVLPRNVSGPPYYLSAESIGTTGGTTVLQMDSVNISGSATLTIKGDVTLFLPPSALATLQISGSGKIVLEAGAKLKIYTPGEINVSGAGIVNSGSPENLQLWSTRNGAGGTQAITLGGSGAISAIVYAPDATLSLPGGTHFYGAAIVKDATLSGSGAFHYDESLLNFGGNSSMQITGYRELDTPALRSPYAVNLSL